ncbi:MAG: hypothetical protein KF753_04925 [Caldilineaceae bacterium]|nr:hypothetical protein [Caldilineaceae bacterium]
MNFTRKDLQLLAVALDYRIQSLRARGGKEAVPLAADNLTLMQAIETHLKETALPVTRQLNRDTADPEMIWA